MPQLFPNWANVASRAGFVLVLSAIPLAAVALMVLVRTPYLTGAGIPPSQPVPFSHEHHAGKLQIDCRYCHDSVEYSPFANVPPTHTCMTCHSQLWTEAPMLRVVRQSLARDRSIRWTRVNHLPDYVYFDHAIHVHQGVGCETCHGAIDEMPLTYAVRPFFMQFCLDCHRTPARHLRPRDQVTATDWKPPDDPEAMGRVLMERYGIDTAKLTDCSICHR